MCYGNFIIVLCASSLHSIYVIMMYIIISTDEYTKYYFLFSLSFKITAYANVYNFFYQQALLL